MSKFDLNIHGIDDVIGKIITINNTSYCIESFLDEGGEKWVYSITNVKSGLNWFVLKIHKFKPGSNVIREKLKRLHNVNIILAKMDFAVVSEYYLIGGALVEIQKSLSMKIPHGALIDETVENKDITERFRVYDQILAENPFHDGVLSIKSEEYRRIGKFHESCEAIDAAIKIEPNRREYYLQRFHLLLDYGMIDYALSSLMNSIDQYAYDGKIWETAMKFACDYDRVKLAKELLSIINTITISEDFIGPYLRLYEASESRYIKYISLLESYNNETNSEEKEKIIRSAIAASKNNEFAFLNLSVLLFENKEFEEAIKNSIRNSASSSTVIALAAQLISAISHFYLNDFQRSIEYFISINKNVDSVFDLPKIPKFVLPENELSETDSQAMFIEEISCDQIIGVLSDLTRMNRYENNYDLIELKNKYNQLESEFNKNDQPQ